MASKTPLEPLFKELDNFIQSSEYENAIGICNKILNIDPNDFDAIVCKIVALIHASKFEEAIKTIDSTKNQDKFIFEKAYSLYRVKRLNESLDVLKTHPQPLPVRISELLAQVYYRLEDYDKCIKVYQDLINEHKVDSAELKTNLCAAYVSAGYTREAEKLVLTHKDSIKDSFEFAYNASCAAIESGNLETAMAYLKLASEICKTTLSQDGASDEEIEDELSIIRTQLAFVLQLEGRNDEALQLYNQVIKTKPSDESVSAVASNNIVVIKKDHDLFDSSKKLKQATTQTVEQKLSTNQKKIIGFNRCLVLLYMNKGDECRELVKTLQQQFPDNDRVALILAALLHKEKKVSQSEELLKTFAEQHPNESLRVQLSLAQIAMVRGNLAEAIHTLESISQLKNKPGLVATLVTLYEQTNQIDSAIKIFDEFCNSIKKRTTDNNDEYVDAIKQNASFKLKHKRYREAATLFEELFKLKSNDLEVLPNLVLAYAQFDPATAERYSNKIPRLATQQEVDAEALENLAAPTKVSKQATEIAAQPNKPNEEVKKKKKKKRVRKAKNFDPNKKPDPERWIPLKQRSYYKPKKSKRKMDKASQGAVVEKKPVVTTNTTQAKPTTTTTTTTNTAKTTATTANTASVAATSQQTTQTTSTSSSKKNKKGKN